MAADIVVLLTSLAVLTVSGDEFVIGLARVAGVLRVRPVVVGAVVGGLATSLPEILVSGVATVQHKPGIAMGNLVGSNISNVSLGLALAALIAPIRVDSKTLRREAPVSVASVLLFALLARGGLSKGEGFVLVAALAVSLTVLLVNARLVPSRDELAVEVTDFFGRPSRQSPRRETLRSIVGLVFLLVGAELLVWSAGDLAHRLGLTEGFVGLTVVAVGTSATQIAAAIQAARRGDHDLMMGILLGCNLFIGLAGGALVAFLPGGSAPGIGVGPLWLMVGVMLGAWAFMTRGVVTRWQAAVLLVAYLATLPFVAH